MHNKTTKKECKMLLYSALALLLVVSGEAALSVSHYSSTCPNVESLVQQAVATKFRQTVVTAQATLRLFFHDCFVQGCDASIMIQSQSGDAEKDAPDNLSLAGDGFDTVIKAKQAVEAACPGIVSCADILALATRDVIVITGGPTFQVELGRLDGLRSKASDVAGHLPGPSFGLNQLVAMFSSHNLSLGDMVALSGAHTIGFSHCNRFSNRLYGFGGGGVDPSLDPAYAQQLKQVCPRNVGPSTVAPMDPITPLRFDNQYYKNLVQKKGIFTSDDVLFTGSSASRALVVDWAEDAGHFNSAFVEAVVKLGRVDVKTGAQGEVRLDCTKFN